MQELWKPVPGFEGLYEASTEGRIRSLDRMVRGVSKAGLEHLRKIRGVTLKPAGHSSGYLSVRLCKEGGGKTVLLHQIIARTFIPRPAMAQCVNHKNGIKVDCRVQNLEWCTFSGNTLHSVSSGLHKAAKGSATGAAKLHESDIPKIRSLISSGVPNSIIAEAFGVAAPQISLIKNKKAWLHVP